MARYIPASRLNVTKKAKKKAARALKLRKSLPKSKKFGLDKQQAKKLGINSGVERAKQIVRSKSLLLDDAKAVSRFYNRFRNCRTKNCEGAIDLWGGRDFGKKATVFVKSSSRSRAHIRRLE